MSVRLVLGQQDADRFEFGSSPGSEALRSLHVLAAVKRHPLHISWVLEMRTRLDARLKSDLDAFRFWFAERPLVLPEIWPPGEVNTWPDDLDLLRKAPVEDFAEPMVHAALAHRGRARRVPWERFCGDAEARERALGQVEGAHAASAAVLRELMADPEGVRERFADFLAAYWDACLAADWPSLEAHLHDEIARRFQTLSRLGPAAMLADLSDHITDHITTAADGSVTIRPPGARGTADPLDVTLAANDRVLLVPSHFMWPELAVAVHRDRDRDRDRDHGETTTVVLSYALAGMARQGRAPVPAEDLLGLLRAAGDATRLQILELLARRSRSTRELAGLIGLTEAAVSKHLKVLHKSGWIVPERHSYYVYYRLEPGARDRVSSGLDRLLGNGN
ncbi:DNA-binding transcriptional ArsR family regulator [Catenulispora sp. GAS73]|uniref:ArsR/SmtB family transcription factor n=1 Tax=Catenulispora sp. GAS73 TaxID=3156269 RepID=UPI0035140431